MLSHWLGTVMGTRLFDSIVDEDPAVWSALHRISKSLDKEPLIFARDYGQRLDEARDRLCSELGEEFVASRSASKNGDQASAETLAE
ncbi:hypothetical protein GA0074696_4792 [Micromonospora purpureochromogenes]|uniref:Uncharacterized protein n=1 Tax=Micromonospora purpureochromogenes TaxID=47872 RepID=A0A1C4ZS79_9ACTN|nr:hypothetical protein GA0074696_4792 [Micromonospora purpureochromogenes]